MRKNKIVKMFGFVKQIFVSAMMFFGCNLSSVNLLKCISTSNHECKVGTKIININSNKPSFYLYSVKRNKCHGSCNNINDPYAKICIPDVAKNIAKNISVKVFNLMSGTNETRYINLHETFKCKCRFDASVYNNKQHWNEDKCRCECKELINKSSCDKGFIWSPSNCECDKSCENSKSRKKLVDILFEECTENIDEVNLAKIVKHENMCKCSCTLYIALFSVYSTIKIGIGTFFVYYKYMNHAKEAVAK